MTETGKDWPSIDGEIDDIKALEFARDLCAMVSGFKSGWGGIHADAERAAASLKALIETAKGFEDSAGDRQEFMETMLRKDGLAVVIYLEASGVRGAMAAQGHGPLAQALANDQIAEHFQEILQGFDGLPPGLVAWAAGVEERVASDLIKACQEEVP